jgi:hypothetical protein
MDKLENFRISIYLHSLLRKKNEFDRLPNVSDLIKRCFAFILKSLERIRDRCLQNRGLPIIHSYFTFSL